MTSSQNFDTSVGSWVPLSTDRTIKDPETKRNSLYNNITRFYKLPGVNPFVSVFHRLKLEATRFQDRYGEYDIELQGTGIAPSSQFIVTLQKPSIVSPKESVRANITLATIQIYDWAVEHTIDLPFNQGEIFRWSDERQEAIYKVKGVFKHFGTETVNKDTEARIYAMLSNQDLNGYGVVSVEIKTSISANPQTLIPTGRSIPRDKYFQALIREAGKDELMSSFYVNSTDGLLD